MDAIPQPSTKVVVTGLFRFDLAAAYGAEVRDTGSAISVPVVFITAYPERFLTGERPEPAFLIAKPFQPATVSAVLSQALFFERKARRRERRTAAG